MIPTEHTRAGPRLRPIVIEGWPNERTPLDTIGSCDLTIVPNETYQHAVRRFLHGAMRLCNAGSAGLSMLSEDSLDIVCWKVVGGALAAEEGRKMPRNRSPCGVCLDTHVPFILCDPERVFPDLKDAFPWISQIAAVPLYDAGRAPIGALWLAQHGAASGFSDEDCSIAQQLAMPLVRTIKALDLLDQRSAALRTACQDLERERHYRELAESAYRKSQQALERKEVEVREVHHRVKNTIQMVATVLQLQARTTASGEVRTALRKGEDRLRSLAAVHELLQASTGVEQAVAMPKLLSIVIDGLRDSFVEPSRVAVHVHTDPITVGISAAIPLALIANEALTNAYKHAFVESSSGVLTVVLQRLGENGLMLEIRDNGVGMAPNGGGKRGLGFAFMERFAQQLGGVISLSTPEQGSGSLLTLTVQNLPME